MKQLYIVLAIVLLSGCTTKVPNVTEYRISTDKIKVDSKKSSCQNISLRVNQAFSSSSLMTTKMNYAYGKYQQDSFSQSEWAESPNKAITSEVIDYVQELKLFKSVHNSKSKSKNNMMLEVNIEEFMQYFSKDEKESFANAAITFTLIDKKNGEIIDSFRSTSQVDTKTLDADGGVEALNSALAEVLNETGVWLGEVCK